jgi:hypothetical protein
MVVRIFSFIFVFAIILVPETSADGLSPLTKFQTAYVDEDGTCDVYLHDALPAHDTQIRLEKEMLYKTIRDGCDWLSALEKTTDDRFILPEEFWEFAGVNRWTHFRLQAPSSDCSAPYYDVSIEEADYRPPGFGRLQGLFARCSARTAIPEMSGFVVAGFPKTSESYSAPLTDAEIPENIAARATDTISSWFRHLDDNIKSTTPVSGLDTVREIMSLQGFRTLSRDSDTVIKYLAVAHAGEKEAKSIALIYDQNDRTVEPFVPESTADLIRILGITDVDGDGLHEIAVAAGNRYGSGGMMILGTDPKTGRVVEESYGITYAEGIGGRMPLSAKR